MPHAVITSPSAAARLDRAVGWLRRRRPAERVLLVGASVEAVSELARASIRGRRATFGWHRLTLGRLAAALAMPALAERGLVPASALAIEALCARTIDGLAQDGLLGRFARVADRPGLPRAVARTLEEVRLSGVAADALAPADLDRIAHAFDAALDDAGLADRAIVLRLAAERARAADDGDPRSRHPLLGLPMLLLDLPVRFALERELLEAVAARSPDALATVPAGDAASLRHLQAALRSPPRRVSLTAVSAAHDGAGAGNGVDDGADDGAGDDLPPVAPSTSLARLQEHLFDPLNDEAPGLGDEVEILSAPGESRECVELARIALREAARGVPFERMAILLRAPEQYRAHLVEALRRAGIPAHFAQGSVQPDPAGRALLALLACAAEHLSASRFAEYLSLGQVPDATPAGEPPPAAPEADRWVPPDDDLFPELLRGGFDEAPPDDDMAGEDLGFDPPGKSFNPTVLNPGPTAPNPGPTALNPGPTVLNPGPTALNPGPTALNPGPTALNPGPTALNPGPTAPNPGPTAHNPDPTAHPPDPTAHPPDPTAQGPDAPVHDGTLRAPRRWERILVDAAVIGGLDRWEARLSGFERELRLELSRAPEDRDAARIARTLADLSALRAFALPLLAALPSPGERATFGEWQRRLSALATRALRRPERVLAVLAELAPMAHVGPVDLSEIRLCLSRRLTDLVLPPAARRDGRLFVSPIEGARGRSFDVVFVPGLAERIFPQKVVEDPILRDALRRAIAGGDSGLDTSDDRVARERLALRLAVGAARQRLVVSYPRVDMDQSRPRVPSFYGLELLRAAEGKLPGFGELERRAEQGGAARIGWPAPARPEDAIDAAEHDLALLETLFSLPEAQTVGTARYLLNANPHLARALRFRARRWIPGWTTADGLFKPIAEAREALAKHAFERRSFSPTALQHFAACPYRFFLYAVHKLAPRPAPEAIEELDPLQRGRLVHDVLYEVLVALRDAGKLPLGLSSLDEARAELDRALDRVAARYADELAPAIRRVWDDGIASVRADLREWLRRAAEDRDWEPIHFELSFGLPRRLAIRDPGSSDAPVELDCGVRLRGSIDLVERSVWGAMRATDYKTGKARAPRDAVVSGGGTLQPVLYALALEKLMPPGTQVESGRLYYCTSAGGFTEVPIYLDARARDAAAQVAGIIGDAIDKAALLPMPAEGACAQCDYRPVCGPYEELRTGKIKRRDIEPRRRLEQLRRLA
ncbi:PD-(D/E)XK nuclease family protein [Sorangium sp. So ce381]|uniref:PD-(D/E)XK nuclease family protein n=1 Tax=Sorangium sp. So ce381 TaxID=3133307 RepID=UPI003F5C75E8